MLKRKFSKSDLFLIVANLIPIYGVWFLGWKPTEAFIVYALETMIVGVLTVLKLLIVTIYNKINTRSSNGSNSQRGGFFLIFFFIFHFGLFALVQTTIFSNIAKITPPNSGPMHFFFNWYTYLNDDINTMLFAFIASYVAKNFIPFLSNGEFKTTSMMTIMIQPYGRIFVQQFTVIIGSLFLSFNVGVGFIIVFALFKIGFELLASTFTITDELQPVNHKDSMK